MSLNQLLLDEQKPYMNIRVQDITIDGSIIGPTGPGVTDTFQEVYDNSNPAVFNVNNINQGLTIRNDVGDNVDPLLLVQNNAGNEDYLNIQKDNIAMGKGNVSALATDCFSVNSEVGGTENVAIGKNNIVDNDGANNNVLVGTANVITGGFNNNLLIGQNNFVEQSDSWIIDPNAPILLSNFRGGVLKGNEGIMMIGNNIIPQNINSLDNTPYVIFQNAKTQTSGNSASVLYTLATEENTGYHITADILTQQIAPSSGGTAFNSTRILKREFVVRNKNNVVKFTQRPELEPSVPDGLGNTADNFGIEAPGVSVDADAQISGTDFIIRCIGVSFWDIVYIGNIKRTEYRFDPI